MNVPTRLTNRNFLLLWQGQVVSQLGNQAFSIAMAFWTLQATGSASLMGLLLASISLPEAIMAPIGGAVADRYSRIRILIVCDVVGGAAMLGQSLAMASGRFQTSTLVSMLFVVALILGVVNAFFLPAMGAAIPDLVPEDKLPAANSLNQFAMQASVLIGQAIGGVMFRLIGAPLLFCIDGLSFLFAAGSESLVRVPPKPPHERLTFGASTRRFVDEIKEGLDYVRRTPGLLAFFVAVSSFNFFVMPVFVLMPIWVQKYLGAGAEWYGFLLAAISCGSIVGFLLTGLVLHPKGNARARFLTILMVVSPVPILATRFVHTPHAALPLAFVLGIAVGLINVNVLTLLQSTTPAELRGRVLGLMGTLSGALVPLGMALGGIAGDLTHKNVPLVFTTCAILTAVVSLVAVGRPAARQFLARDV
jgi:MFS family permease